MNKKQKEIVKRLKQAAKEKRHSPTRREIPHLAKKCYRYFGSFNKAKQLAGLGIKNIRILNFPKNVFKRDKDLAFITAYLTTDGHLYKDLKGFYFSAKDLGCLKHIEKRLNKKFGLNGIYRKGDGFGQSFKLLFFNSRIVKFLNKSGVPVGDKMIIPFDVPNWIKKDKELSKEYLKILFFCEGSKYKQSKNTEAIRINFNKSEKLLENGLKFMDSLKFLLKRFGIATTNTWIMEGNKRKKDGEITKLIRFGIKSNNINKFINEIGWLK